MPPTTLPTPPDPLQKGSRTVLRLSGPGACTIGPIRSTISALPRPFFPSITAAFRRRSRPKTAGPARWPTAWARPANPFLFAVGFVGGSGQQLVFLCLGPGLPEYRDGIAFAFGDGGLRSPSQGDDESFYHRWEPGLRWALRDDGRYLGLGNLLFCVSGFFVGRFRAFLQCVFAGDCQPIPHRCR